MVVELYKEEVYGKVFVSAWLDDGGAVRVEYRVREVGL